MYFKELPKGWILFNSSNRSTYLKLFLSLNPSVMIVIICCFRGRQCFYVGLLLRKLSVTAGVRPTWHSFSTLSFISSGTFKLQSSREELPLTGATRQQITGVPLNGGAGSTACRQRQALATLTDLLAAQLSLPPLLPGASRSESIPLGQLDFSSTGEGWHLAS